VGFGIGGDPQSTLGQFGVASEATADYLQTPSTPRIGFRSTDFGFMDLTTDFGLTFATFAALAFRYAGRPPMTSPWPWGTPQSAIFRHSPNEC
jgi:hypothetical protein